MVGPSYAPTQPVAFEPTEVRSAFLSKVYGHLLVALGVFFAVEVLFFMSGIAEGIYNFLATRGGGSWLLLVGAVVIVEMLATRSAHNMGNINAQYAGLFAMAVAQAVIFAPFLYLVFNTDGAGTVVSAAVLTGVGFGGLTAVGLLTRRDLSRLRGLVMWGGIVALLLVVGAVLFGLNLGVWFSVAMIGLAGASILYQTQTIMRQYPSWAYVGAALQLFASVMMLFWYVLRLLSSMRR